MRGAAFLAATGLRSLFNRPEIVAAVRSTESEESNGPTDSYWRQVLRYGLDGNLQSVLDEFSHTLTESEGLGSAGPHERADAIADRIAATASTRAVTNSVQDIKVNRRGVSRHERHLNAHFAARFGRDQSSEAGAEREATVRESYNSPFWPFVLATTSIGQEGLDFHTYSHAVVHWNLPSNPVDMEQREGRVHRYKGHAVRKNIAEIHADAALEPEHDDPWAAMFDAAVRERPDSDALLNPFWVFPDGRARIERYVPAMPLSREAAHYEQLQKTLGRTGW